jgi:hypothetical protein
MVRGGVRGLLPAVLLISATACGNIAVPADRQDYVGVWTGGGMTLAIAPNGRVEYERQRGASSTSISAPLRRFEGDDLVVGIPLFSTRFDVQRPPRLDSLGWSMVVDGVELHRK